MRRVDRSDSFILLRRATQEIGGVEVSARILLERLESEGYTVDTIDLSHPFEAARRVGLRQLGGRRRTPLVCWISSLNRIKHYSIAARLHRGRALAVIHAATNHELAGPLNPRWISAFDTLIVSNSSIRLALQRGCPGSDVRVATPHTFQCNPVRVEVENAAAVRVMVAVCNANPLYGVDLAIQAVEQARRSGRTFHLDILSYGAKPLIRDHLPSWAKIVEQLPHRDLQERLAQLDILLRPTATDGDSLLVREALDAGCRVIASDVVPRPSRCEVVPLEAPAFAMAILSSSAHSSVEQQVPHELTVAEAIRGFLSGNGPKLRDH